MPLVTDDDIYASPIKLSDSRIQVRLDVPIMSATFSDTFSGSSLDTTKWPYSNTPPGCQITVSGGSLTLSGTDTNGFPVIESQPGQTFPLDPSIGWTMDWDDLSFPTITGYGVFCRVIDLTNEEAILAVKCNSADGLTVEMPDGTLVESLGVDASAHDYQLIYTPATNIAAATYELKRDGVTKKTMNVGTRQAWSIVVGNGSVQTSIGTWTQVRLSGVTVTPTSFESQSWPEWTDRSQDGDGVWWGCLYPLSSSWGFHERNDVDQCVFSLSRAGYITGVGYREDWFKDFVWANREVILETRQGNGYGWTDWATQFRGLCDEPRVSYDDRGPTLEVTVRDKMRRRLQMSRPVRGYSDASDPIDGVVMGKSWTEIIEDVCDLVGLATTDYNVLSSTLKPRTYQLMDESALDAVTGLARDGVAAVYVNRSQANFGRLEIQDYDWGSETPDFYVSPDGDAVGIDWSETDMGLTAQVLITVQHSEFGEFSDSYPRAPVPPFGAVVRRNSSIAQVAADIQTTRQLHFLEWKQLNRELNSVAVRTVGQDTYQVGQECQVKDRRILGIDAEHYVVIGADYNWAPAQGILATVYLANQHPEKAVMKASLVAAVSVTYPPPALSGDLNPAGVLTVKVIRGLSGALSFAGANSYV